MEKLKYEALFQRNIGFVDEIEQQKIKNQKIFILGVGGMGGAALMNLVRMGYVNIGIADIDLFEESNLNRQLFCNTETIGKDKAESAVDQVLRINPAIHIKNWGPDWIKSIDKICQEYKIIVNGCDDIFATNCLYLSAKKEKAIVIDAYTASVPSVYVTRPEDPSPLKRWLGLEHLNREDEALMERYKLKEAEYVMVNSNPLNHIHLPIALEMIQGKRSRMSLAPMVITTGCLMAYQVLFLTLDKKATNYHGFFMDPYGSVTKHNWGPISFFKKYLVKYLLNKWMKN